MKKYDKLWEESKQFHHQDVQRRQEEFRKEFQKWEFLMRLVSIIFPSLYKKFYHSRQPVKKDVSRIVQDYSLRIIEAFRDREYWFNLWEKENSDLKKMSASEDTRLKESKSLTNLVHICDDFIEDLKKVKKYNTFFHPIENPMKFIENPYPGYMCTRRAQNYMKMLVGKF